MKENSELTGRVTTLSDERATLKHTLACQERQLRRSENELTKITTETENRLISNDAITHGKVRGKNVLNLFIFSLVIVVRLFYDFPLKN